METVLSHYFPKKSWYEQNGIYLDLNVTGDFSYYDLMPVYDINGNYVDDVQTNWRSKRETHRLKCRFYEPIQINYDFYLANMSRTVTIEELQNISHTLNKSNLGVFDTDFNVFSSPIYICDWHKANMKPVEVCVVGHSRAIFRNSFSSFFELDYKEYNNRKNKFKQYLKNIKKENDVIMNEYLIEEVDKIFNYNIKVAAEYYNTTEEKILKNDFNRQAKMIERLQNKITYKQKNK